MSLLRGNQGEWQASVLGELLKGKAENGVKVLVMTWNDKSTFAISALEELSAMMGYDAMKGILKYVQSTINPEDFFKIRNFSAHMTRRRLSFLLTLELL